MYGIEEPFENAPALPVDDVAGGVGVPAGGAGAAAAAAGAGAGGAGAGLPAIAGPPGQVAA